MRRELELLKFLLSISIAVPWMLDAQGQGKAMPPPKASPNVPNKVPPNAAIKPSPVVPAGVKGRIPLPKQASNARCAPFMLKKYKEKVGDVRKLESIDNIERLCNCGESEFCLEGGILLVMAGLHEEGKRLFGTGCQAKHVDSCRLHNVHVAKKDSKILRTDCTAKKINSCLFLAYNILQENKAEQAIPLLRTACQGGQDLSCKIETVARGQLEHPPIGKTPAKGPTSIAKAGSPMKAASKSSLSPENAKKLTENQSKCSEGKGPNCFIAGNLLQSSRDVTGAIEMFRRACELKFQVACKRADDLEYESRNPEK